MKKGFSMIEIIVGIMLLVMLIVPIYGMNSACFRTNNSSRYKDEEFNIARAVCEKFKSELGAVENKWTVLYADNPMDLPINITETVQNSIYYNIVSSELIKSNNLNNKKYAVIICSSSFQSLYYLKVKVLSMADIETEVALRIAR